VTARRLAACAVIALGHIAARASAGDPPVELAEWEARDVEGRWAALRASLDATNGGSEGTWIGFLAKRGEWDLLEWLALTSRNRTALGALETADAPAWLRVAAWQVGGADSHSLETAKAALVRHPALAASWLEAHPTALPAERKTLLEELRAKDATRVDVARYLPPHDPEVLLADLRPAASIEETGVARVERAILVLAHSRLRGEPWSSRLAALLEHPHPRVRRAAALSYAHRPADENPRERLDGLVEAADQPPDVRVAALVGLSYSQDPAAYDRLLRVATDPAHVAWKGAVSRLGDLDDGFAPFAWDRALAERQPGAGYLAFAREQAGRIAERTKAHDAAAFAKRVPVLLERAAWVDLHCSPFEGDLVEWTTGAVKARAGEPPVREALTALTTPGDFPLDLAGAVRERVRGYATDLLAAKAPGATR
jgi:hypothetical protein